MNNEKDHWREFATDSLVDSMADRVETSGQPRSGDGRKSGTKSTLHSVSLDPMPIATTRKLVRRLLAGYPNLAAHDPKGYLAEMIEVMSQYPEWAGQRAIVKVDEENTDFPPPVPKLRRWLDDAVRPYRFAHEWNARTQKQIEDRPAEEVRPTSTPSGQIYTNFTEAFAKYGRPIGPFEAEREKPYRS
jgi:hypothetical protein